MGEEDPMQQPRTLIFHIINNDLEKGENKPWSLSPDLFSLQATERAAPWRPWSSVLPFRLLAAVQTQVLRATTTPPLMIDDCQFPWAFYNISSGNVPWRKCAIIHHAITVPSANSNCAPSNFIMVSIFILLYVFTMGESLFNIQTKQPCFCYCNICNYLVRSICCLAKGITYYFNKHPLIPGVLCTHSTSKHSILSVSAKLPFGLGIFSFHSPNWIYSNYLFILITFSFLQWSGPRTRCLAFYCA